MNQKIEELTSVQTFFFPLESWLSDCKKEVPESVDLINRRATRFGRDELPESLSFLVCQPSDVQSIYRLNPDKTLSLLAPDKTLIQAAMTFLEKLDLNEHFQFKDSHYGQVHFVPYLMFIPFPDCNERCEPVWKWKWTPQTRLVKGRDEKMKELAQIAYEAYGDSASWKNFSGGEMPQWKDLPDAIQQHWRAAINATQKY